MGHFIEVTQAEYDQIVRELNECRQKLDSAHEQVLDAIIKGGVLQQAIAKYKTEVAAALQKRRRYDRALTMPRALGKEKFL